MDRLSTYAEEKEKEFREMRERYVERAKRGTITEFDVKMMMNRSYQMGHHVGHIRGEQYKQAVIKNG